MSTKLVRRLLQQTTDFDHSEEPVDKRRKEIKKRKKRDDLPPADEDEIIEQQVQSMLYLDRQMAYRGNKKEEALERIHKQQQRETKIRKKSTSIVLGNSRGAASKMRLAPAATFNKKKYKKEKEEKRLEKIAKLLRKNSKKTG